MATILKQNLASFFITRWDWQIEARRAGVGDGISRWRRKGITQETLRTQTGVLQRFLLAILRTALLQTGARMKMKTLFALALLAFSIHTLHAADTLDEKQFQKLMKEVGGVAKRFKDNAQAKNGANIEKDATRTAAIYTQMTGFWKGRQAEDAAKMSEASAAAATATAAAAKAGEWDKVKASWGAVGKNCKDCHDKHREKLEDGGYKIK
jgi:cytochrome c556